MKGLIHNEVYMKEHVHQPRKITLNQSSGTHPNNVSPKFNKSNPDTKLCIFERDRSGYGFKITGDTPIKVQAVSLDGVAWASGLRENDVILTVNGTAVTHIPHKDVVALIRKNTRVELLVKRDTLSSISTASNSSPKRKPPSAVLNRLPKTEARIVRPNSIPKVTQRPKTSSENQLYKQNNFQSLDRSNYNGPLKPNHSIKTEERNRSQSSSSSSSDSSSDCCISTSSDESTHSKTTLSNSPHKQIVYPPRLTENKVLENELPKNRLLKNGLPAKDLLKNRLSKNGCLQNGLPESDIQKNRLSKNELPENELPLKRLPKNELPIKRLPKNELHENEFSKNGLPKNEIPENELSIKRLPKNELSENELPKNRLPKNQLPEIELPKNRLPKNELPENELAKNRLPKNELPAKQNLYNIHNDIIATKHESLQKNPFKERLKNKTIPSDGVKSFNKEPVSDNEVRFHPEPSYNTLPKKKSSGLFLGRDFDDNNNDEEESECSLSVVEMFSSVKDALSRPCLVAIMLSYVKEDVEDLKIMILYYTCKLFKSLTLSRTFPLEAQRMANEIITTFFLEKSPLYIAVNIDVIDETLTIFKNSEILGGLFDKVLEMLLKVLKVMFEDVRGKLTRGIQLSEDVSALVTSINSAINLEKEMSLLQRTMCNIFIKMQKDLNYSDSVLATQIGLATMYHYFHKSSITAKSSDCINNMVNQAKIQSISELFKVSTFCGTYQPKLSLGLRKKSKSVIGHMLIEVALQQPEECAICDGLLWGPSPQGFFCSMCNNYYHMLCKKKIKTQCTRKLRKSNSQIPKEEKTAFFGRLSRKSSTNSGRNVNVAGDVNNNGTLISDDKTSSVFVDENMQLSNTPNEDQLDRANNVNFERFGHGHDINGSIINQSMDNDPNAVIQELLPDETMIDPDMKVSESFDAAIEINDVFPNTESQSDKKRLIILLEFYHKTRYILMNLKRFQYTLVQKWPSTQYLYFKALSLDCITPFVNLTKSLILTIQNCITDQTFVGLEQAVLDWLSINNDERLKEWISLSINLCCTNSLNIVKQMKQTTLRTVAELIPLMNAKFHKMIVIDELTQIRPLLISLPFIVKNIIKCMSKQEEEYLEELTVWKQVSIKMDYLCEYMDKCSMPLINWVNNGLITRRPEKFEVQIKCKESEREIKDFCLDFPRTLFHFPIFDFQYAKIMNWSTNTKRMGMEIQCLYFKKGTDVLLIFYKTFIVVLQKENDHYILKPIKPLRNIFDKQAPIIDISNDVLCNIGGQEENQFILNIISHKPDNALLLRIGFSRSEVVESWMNYINTKNYNLGNSISLFKNNDLPAISFSTGQFERTGSSVSGKSKISHDSVDNALIVNTTPEIKEKVVENEDEDSVFISLSDTLTTVSKTLDQNQSLYTHLKVSEETLPSQIKFIEDDGAKSLKELTFVCYTLSQALIQETQRLVSKCSAKESHLEKGSLSDIRGLLNSTCTIMDKWEQSTTEEEIVPKVVLRSSSKPDSALRSTEVQVRMRSLDHINESQRMAVDVESLIQQPSDNDFTEAVKDIVQEIIDEAIRQVKRKSYKYVPANSFLPSFTNDDHLFLTNAVLTPSSSHLNSPLDDTVTVSRAQITLRPKTYVPDTTNKH